MADMTALLQQFQQPTGGGWSPGFVERGQRAKFLDAASKDIYKALQPEEDPITGEVKPHPLGMDANQFESLSRDERIARVGALIAGSVLKQANEAQKRQQEESNVRMQGQYMDIIRGKQQMEDRARQQAAADALDKAFGEAGTATVPGTLFPQSPEAPGLYPPNENVPVPAAMTPEGLMSAVARNRQAVNAPQFDNVLRILETGARQRTKGAPMPFTSARGTPGVYSADTGAFQFDPAVGIEARAALQPRDALKTYNDNQERISALNQRLKMAKQPDMGQYFDADAINAELLDLQQQQNQLRPVFGGRAGAPSPAAGAQGAARPDYKTAEDVRAAFKANKIDRATAKKILAEQFGLK